MIIYELKLETIEKKHTPFTPRPRGTFFEHTALGVQDV